MTWILILISLWALIGAVCFAPKLWSPAPQGGVRLHKVWLDHDGLLWIQERRFSRPRTYSVWEQKTFFPGDEQ